MKLSILTATYNRGNLLPKLYESIVKNLIDDMDVEWLIMDDGSSDNTKEILTTFKNMKHLEVKFYRQENKGKMQAINSLIEYASGELIVECDSDDYFSEEAFKKIYSTYKKNESNNEIYGYLFLKYDQNNNNIGKELIDDKKTTMYDLYFKDKEDGEKSIVFIADIRKKYKYELENGEKFITEASMFYRMDEKYNVLCVNSPIMICEYQKNGYTKNIKKVFKENPRGFFKYFEYLLAKDLTNVDIRKKLYIVKHYILFSYLSKMRIKLKSIKNMQTKALVIILFIPGKIASYIRFKK